MTDLNITKDDIGKVFICRDGSEITLSDGMVSVVHSNTQWDNTGQHSDPSGAHIERATTAADIKKMQEGTTG